MTKQQNCPRHSYVALLMSPPHPPIPDYAKEEILQPPCTTIYKESELDKNALKANAACLCLLLKMTHENSTLLKSFSKNVFSA